MKKICFIELEGVLTHFGDYKPDQKRVLKFLDTLCRFLKKNKINIYIISGHHEPIAIQKKSVLKFPKYIPLENFLFVDEEYIKNKAEMDHTLHRQNLSKDPEFVDTFFKQIVIQKILKEKKLSAKDALLLSDDIWVDGYYTTRFSKVDFAILSENVVDRGKKINPISGLAYFSLDFDSVKCLLINFPVVDTSALDLYVFEEMKKVLVGQSFVDAVKRELIKKQVNN